MKTKINLLLLILVPFFYSSLFSQSERPMYELLNQLNQNHIGGITEVFTPNEIQRLRTYFDANEENTESSILNRRLESTQSVTPVTVVKIDPTDLSSIEELLPSTATDFEGAGFVLNNPSNGSIIVDNSNKVYLRGINTGIYTHVTNINTLPPGHSITGIEVLSDNSQYMVSTDGSSSRLYSVDPITYDLTEIGDMGVVLSICLGRDSADNLFTVDIDDDKLYGIDKTTGVATAIGPIGFNANFGQGMTYDPAVDKLLMTAFNNSLFDSELREFNTSTGMSMSLGTIVPGFTCQFGWAGYYDADVLDITDAELSGFSFYPNPVDNFLMLHANENIESIEIYSILGQKVIVNNTSSENSKIDVSYLHPGTYILKVSILGEVGTYKMIKN